MYSDKKCYCGSLIESFRVEELNSSVCSACAKNIDTPKKMGIMVWDHKTAPTMQVVDAATHQDFTKQTNRKGQSSILRQHSPRI